MLLYKKLLLISFGTTLVHAAMKTQPNSTGMLKFIVRNDETVLSSRFISDVHHDQSRTVPFLQPVEYQTL